MNFKKILLAVVTGAALLTLAGAALSMPASDINIYGASAQYNFWKAEGANFLADQGCTVNGSRELNDGSSEAKKHFIVNATCGANSVNIRVSSKASYDGVLALQNNTVNPNAAPGGCPGTQRLMLTAYTGDARACYTVTIGASDVVVGDFFQTSVGQKLGPYEGGSITRNFLGANAITDAGVTDYCRPLTIPFAFFINNSVKLADGVTQPTDINLVTAKIIFGSGALADWSDLPGYNAGVINVCFRHAGSGTHATINSLFPTLASAVVNLPKVAGGGGLTYSGSNYFFNDGSADEMKCVNGAGLSSGAYWDGTGAIGYADADQDLTNYPATHRLTFNGVVPTRANVINSSYPFITVQNMYVTPGNAADATLIALCNHAADPINVHRANGFWAPTCAFPVIPYSLFSGWVYNVGNGNTWDYLSWDNIANPACTGAGTSTHGPEACCVGFHSSGNCCRE
jgi:ABC-type phosphate transport system substrate-binding protein